MDMQERPNVNIIITDACILIDLIELNLIDQFLQTMQNVYTTNQVVREITDPVQKQKLATIIASGQILTDDTADFSTLLTLQAEYTSLSIPDCSVLELAIRKQGIVFTSDGRLRKACANKGLDFYGVLWIIENLFISNIVNKEIALSKLKLLSIINSRAPLREINKVKIKIEQHDN